MTTMDMVCVAVISDGGQDVSGYPFSIGRTSTIPVTTRRAVLSIRPTATYNSLTNRMLIHPHMIEALVGGVSAYWELVYNPTFTTAGGALTWSAVDTLSGVEYRLHGDANAGAFTGGFTVESGYVSANSASRAQLSHDFTFTTPLTLDAAGLNPRALTLAFTRVGISGTSDCVGSISWHEHR